MTMTSHTDAIARLARHPRSAMNLIHPQSVEISSAPESGTGTGTPSPSASPSASATSTTSTTPSASATSTTPAGSSTTSAATALALFLLWGPALQAAPLSTALLQTDLSSIDALPNNPLPSFPASEGLWSITDNTHWSDPIQLQQPLTVHTPDLTTLHIGGTLTAVNGLPMGIIKEGSGTLILSGHNTYNANTHLRAGTLQVQGSQALGATNRTLEQDTGTILGFEAGSTLHNAVQLRSPAGQASVEWQVNAGQARHTATLNGEGTVRKTGNGLLEISGMTSRDIAAQVEQGSLSVDGLFSGAVQVAAGAELRGNGTIGSVRMQPGSRLLPGHTGANYPTTAGNSTPGTLVITGSLQMAPDSTLAVRALPDGRSDQVHVMGTAQLNGQIQAMAQQGNWNTTTQYTLVTAEQGVSGTFQGAETNLAFLTPTLHYDTSKAYLTLQRNDTAIGDLDPDPGPGSVGDIIDTVVPPTPPVPPVEPPPPTPPVPPVTPPVTDPPQTPPVTPPATEPPALPATPLTPAQPLPPVDTPTPQDPPSNGDTPLNPPATPPSTQNPDAPPEGNTDPPASGSTTTDTDQHPAETAQAADHPLLPLYSELLTLTPGQARQTLHDLGAHWSSSVLSQLQEDSRFIREAALEHSRVHGPLHEPGAWASAYGSSSHRSAYGAVAGDQRTLTGLAIGLRYRVSPEHTVGVVAGADTRHHTRNGTPASTRIQTQHVGATTAYQLAWGDVVAGGIYSRYALDHSRDVALGLSRHTLHSSQQGSGFQGFVSAAFALNEAARQRRQPNVRAVSDKTLMSTGPAVSLHVGLAGVHTRLAAHQEHGAVSALHYRASHATHAITTAALVLEHDQVLRNGLQLAWKARLGWQGTLGPRAAATQAYFVHDPSATIFSSSGQPLARSAVNVSLGAHARVNAHTTLRLDYLGHYAKGYRDHGGRIGMEWAF